MKLYMKQKVFSWRDRFYIKDEYEEDRYYVEGELFSWGKKLHVYDMTGAEVAFHSAEGDELSAQVLCLYRRRNDR